jgi:hypothetical protein
MALKFSGGGHPIFPKAVAEIFICYILPRLGSFVARIA